MALHDQATTTADPGSPATTGADWPAQAADTIVRVVDQVKGKTTDRAIVVARVVVYGLLAALLGLAALVLVAIAAVRFIDAYLPDAVFGEQHTWAAHLLIGAAFVLVGAVAWSQRHARTG